MRFYRLDLRVEYGGATVRRLLALIRGLPADSATWAGDSWSTQDEMLAAAVELIDGWGRLHWMALGQDGRKITDAREYGLRVNRPEGVETPDEPSEKITTTDTRVIAQWFAEHH